MKKFEFRLQRVLDWRHLQLNGAEARLGEVRQQLRDIDLRLFALREDRISSENMLREGEVVHGAQVASLDQYLRAITSTEIGLLRTLRELEQKLTEALATVAVRRREHRLVEILKERGRHEWHQAFDRELEQIAADSYRSRWVQESAAAATGSAAA
jgi:flagellar export protein FliJ